MAIRRKDFATAEELIAFLLEDKRFQPRTIFDATSRGVKGLIFRGQREVNEGLLPSAHRQPNRLGEYTPQPPGALPAKDDARTENPFTSCRNSGFASLSRARRIDRWRGVENGRERRGRRRLWSSAQVFSRVRTREDTERLHGTRCFSQSIQVTTRCTAHEIVLLPQ